MIASKLDTRHGSVNVPNVINHFRPMISIVYIWPDCSIDLIILDIIINACLVYLFVNNSKYTVFNPFSLIKFFRFLFENETTIVAKFNNKIRFVVRIDRFDSIVLLGL